MRSQRISLLALTSTLSLSAASILTLPSYASNMSEKWSSRQSAEPKTLVAQVFRTTLTIPAGQVLVTRLADSSTLYISTGQSVPARLRVEVDVRGTNGAVLIPAGAVIDGQFVPVPGGSKFVAKTLSTRGATVSMGAESSIIHDVKDPRSTNIGAIATHSAIGAAGAAILAGVTGDRAIATEEVLAGAAAGGIIGNVTAPQATVVETNNTINLTTNRDLAFRTGGD